MHEHEGVYVINLVQKRKLEVNGGSGIPVLSSNIAESTLDRESKATKEFFIPVTSFSWNAVWSPLRTFNYTRAVAPLEFTDDTCGTNFRCPHDFHKLTDAYYIVYTITVGGEAAAAISLYADMSASGEQYNVHWASDTDNTYALTEGQITQIDVSAMLANMDVADYVGVGLRLRANHKVAAIGVMIYYW